jgi:hypothetical protein
VGLRRESLGLFGVSFFLGGFFVLAEMFEDEAGDILAHFGGDVIEHEALDGFRLFGEPFDEAGAEGDLGEAGFLGELGEAGLGVWGYLYAQDHTGFHGRFRLGAGCASGDAGIQAH